ncbi:MAG TPA: hypothetical protein DCY00_07490, partial [Actinobacteria bacterium]|nr:hypothetical protein [Actinomycetota bacterium]
MNRIAELKHKINTLETVVEQLKEKLRIEEESANKVTRTGKIITLIIGRPYWIVGQRGQIYSVKLTPKNEPQLEYL